MIFFLKRSFFLSLSFALLLIIAPNASRAQQTQPDQPVNLQSQAALVTEFDVNGLKVLFKRRPNSSTVAAGLFVRGGVKNLTAENAGIENLALTAAAEASKKYPRETLRRELARTGAVISAGSNYDFSVFSLGTPRADFDRTWDVFTDIILRPSFAPPDVERVRGQLLTGLRQQSSDSDSYLTYLEEKSAFANHPYANNPIGTIETVAKFKPDELRQYQTGILQTSRLLLVVVGDLNAETLKTKIAETLGKLPRGDYQDKPLPALKFDASTVEITPRDIPTNYIQGNFTAPSAKDDDVYPMRVATTILRDRIFEEVRVNRQLSYAPSASLDERAVSTGSIYVTTTDSNQSIGVMLDEIKKLQTELVDDYTIKGIVGQYLTTYYLGQETNSAQVADLATSEIIAGDWRNAFEVLNKTRQVTPEAVRRVAQKYMKNIRFVVLGDPKSVDKAVFIK